MVSKAVLCTASETMYAIALQNTGSAQIHKYFIMLFLYNRVHQKVGRCRTLSYNVVAHRNNDKLLDCAEVACNFFSLFFTQLS